MFKIELKNQEAITIDSFKDLTDSQRQNITDQYLDGIMMYNMNSEVEFILSSSLEDNNAPFNHDDIENNNPWGDVEINGKWLELSEDDKDELLEECQEKLEVAESFISILEEKLEIAEDNGNDLQAEEIEKEVEAAQEAQDKLQDDCDQLEGIDCYEQYPEVMEWILCSSHLIYNLKEAGEVVLNGEYWGRCSFGQAWSMDCIIQKIAFDVMAFEVDETKAL